MLRELEAQGVVGHELWSGPSPSFLVSAGQVRENGDARLLFRLFNNSQSISLKSDSRKAESFTCGIETVARVIDERSEQ